LNSPAPLLSITALALAGAVGIARVAGAQTSAVLDAGGTRAAYGGSESVGALSISPALRIDRSAFSLDAAGTLSRFTESWSAQANITASYFAGAFGPVQGEVEATADGTAQPGAASTGAASGAMRLHLLAERRGLWIGGQVGGASNGAISRSTMAADLGAWGRIGGATGVLRVAPSLVGNALRYVDAQAVARVERGRLEMTAALGLRDWSEPASAATTGWGSLNGTFWLGDHLALTLGGGSYPADPAQGFTAGRFVSFGVRLATGRPTSRQAVSSVIDRTLPPIEPPVAEGFRAYQARTGEWTLEVSSPAADRVELMGDFTEWKVVPLRRRADGRWSVTLAIAPGTHRMNLRVNGGAWGVPPGVPVLRDEFSGVVALLTAE
jgi:hypothetical protein